MRCFTLLLAGSLVASGAAEGAAAHDFWVQPRVFSAAVEAIVPVTIEVGHGAARQRWSVPPDRVASFVTVGPDGTRDRRAALHLDAPTSDADLRFAKPGTYLIALTTTRATSVLPGIRFTDYAKTEGLTPLLVARAKAGTSNTPGRETYSRRAKAIVRIGGVASPAVVTRPLGMTLEIVPDRDPNDLGPNEPLPVRVLYEGRPLGGAFVKLTNLDFDARPVRTATTDAAGRASVAIPFAGLWQMNVIWTKPLAGSPDADWDTVFSSLTFGTVKPGQAIERR